MAGGAKVAYTEHRMQASALRPWLPALLAVVGGVAGCQMAAGALPGETTETPELLTPDAGGRFGLQGTAAPGFYYRLLRSGTPTGPARCVGLHSGGPGRWELRDPLPMTRQGYYRVEAIPLGTPLDSDEDGRDDFTERSRQPVFSPIQPVDSRAARNS